MKKLLLPLFVIGSLSVANSQNQNLRSKSSGLKNGQAISKLRNDVSFQSGNSSANIGNVKNKPQNLSGSKIAAATKFTGSMNAFGVLISTSKPLQYNAGVNTLSFIHRKSATYNASSNSNSGTIVGMISTNNGVSWDSTCIWASAINFGRYPQGGIYNPSGNTNKNNSYLVGTGPITGGAGWLGNWYASKSLNGAGTNTPGPDQQAHLDAAPTIKKHAMSRYSFTAIDGGLVRSVATLVNDINATTFAAYGMRGAALVKGQFTAGAMVWSVDSFVPCVMNRSDGSKYLTDVALQAWNENGTTGYIIMLGIRCGATSCQKSYQPIIYKTTNSGASWSLIPAGTFNASFLTNRIASVNTNSNLAVPYFSTNEGWDAVVDNNNNLHLACTVLGAYSTHNDSLDYTYGFGTQQYDYSYGGGFEYPTIYDFRYSSSGQWSGMIVDSMGTEGPSGTSGYPGYNTNVWSDGSGGKLDLDARIQMSKTTDGSKIFFSWAESDSAVVGLKWNIYPDIKLKGYDVAIDKRTGRYNVTGGVNNADQQSYFHYMCNKAIGSSTACTEVPYTISYNSTNDGGVPVEHYFVNGPSLCQTSYTVTGMFGNFVNFSSACSVVDVNDINALNENVTIYPNPVTNNVYIKLGNWPDKTCELRIFDCAGRIVFNKAAQLNSDNSLSIDMLNYDRGMYLIEIKSSEWYVIKKIIKE